MGHCWAGQPTPPGQESLAGATSLGARGRLWTVLMATGICSGDTETPVYPVEEGEGDRIPPGTLGGVM